VGGHSVHQRLLGQIPGQRRKAADHEAEWQLSALQRHHRRDQQRQRKQTNVHALAGNHVPTTPRAEESTWMIVVGHDTVRITASSIPPELRAKLEPLLKVLGEAASVGKRDMPQSCSSKRTVNGIG
jgi:hypothetical protein